MAGTVLEIWLSVSALSSLAIIGMAIGYSDLRVDHRARTRSRPPRRPQYARRHAPR
ncbi:hypothetical protein [Sphingomonas sp. Leaf21]|uniref:hypothetical protein n=1 Tax=Sphingomonas sp. Leaf21 TaxID=2876550 RepID=UPI001E485494|nr:hypothetical protein [Sphingomonas sp. Leaf21]